MIPKHTTPHRYIRIYVGLKKRSEMKCSLPGCVHHIRPELAIGRESLCCECGEVFILTKYNIKKHAKPKCIKCIASKDNNVEKLTEIFQEQS